MIFVKRIQFSGTGHNGSDKTTFWQSKNELLYVQNILGHLPWIVQDCTRLPILSISDLPRQSDLHGSVIMGRWYWPASDHNDTQVYSSNLPLQSDRHTGHLFWPVSNQNDSRDVIIDLSLTKMSHKSVTFLHFFYCHHVTVLVFSEISTVHLLNGKFPVLLDIFQWKLIQAFMSTFTSAQNQF